MDKTTRVQIQDVAIYILRSVNTSGKVKNLTILHSAMSK